MYGMLCKETCIAYKRTDARGRWHTVPAAAPVALSIFSQSLLAKTGHENRSLLWKACESSVSVLVTAWC